MSFNFYDKFSSAHGVLKAVASSQEMVSGNIANSHTPGYTAKSLSFSQLIGNQHNPFETRLARKMGSSQSPMAVGETGLPVDLRKEMITMQKNMLFYSMATRRTSSIFNTLRTASQIGR